MRFNKNIALIVFLSVPVPLNSVDLPRKLLSISHLMTYVTSILRNKIDSFSARSIVFAPVLTDASGKRSERITGT